MCLRRGRHIRLTLALVSMLAVLGILAAVAPPANAGAMVRTQQADNAAHVVRLKGASFGPDSASGCNGDICIYVCNNISCTGSGNYITYVEGEAHPPLGDTTNPTTAKVWVRGVVRYTLSGLSLASTVYAYFPFDYNVDVGSQICVTFTGIPGKPCETVE